MLDDTGVAICWGYNQAGRLGTGDQTTRFSPTPVATDLRFIAVAAGGTHTCAIAEDGRAYCWGYNHLGQLGDGSLTSRALPTPVSTDLRFVDVTTGVAHTCARTPEGTAYCWGAAGEGQLGTEATLASCELYGCSLVPVPVSGGHVFNNLTAGTFTCGAAADGSYCWGAYLLGDTASVPVPVRTRGSSGEPFLKMSIGFDHACGIVAGELAYCWGSDYQGKLGDGPVEGGPLPVLVREAPDSLRPL